MEENDTSPVKTLCLIVFGVTAIAALVGVFGSWSELRYLAFSENVKAQVYDIAPADNASKDQIIKYKWQVNGKETLGVTTVDAEWKQPEDKVLEIAYLPGTNLGNNTVRSRLAGSYNLFMPILLVVSTIVAGITALPAWKQLNALLHIKEFKSEKIEKNRKKMSKPVRWNGYTIRS